MDMGYWCVGLVLFTVTIHKGHATGLLNVQSIQDEFKKLEDKGLGVRSIQEYYDSLTYTSVDIDGPGMLKTITENLGRKFQGLYEAANSINNAVKANHKNFQSTIPSGIQECCTATGVSDNLKFLSQVDVSKSCVTQPHSSSTGISFPDTSIESVMKTNYDKNPSLLWQYFASETGTAMLYPKVKVDDCNSYDPRYRPFYASSATPMPKDVVVVIDTSGSMETEMKGRSRISIAKEAATTVTNTLSPNDRVGIVSFSNTAKTPSKPECYKDTLSLATTDNKATIETFINTLQTEGPSNFGEGLKAAFLYFRNSDLSIHNEDRTRVILFITDQMDYEGENPLHVIRDENKLLNNTVVIMTYGIGQKETDDSLLKQMSKQQESNSTYGTPKIGLTTYIEDPESLRSQMGSYYSFFRIQSKDRIFTGPFVDTFSEIGLIISVCVPTYDISDLLGVACADMKLFDLFSEVNVFEEGEYSYIFIIDEFGRTLKHPLLQIPRTITENHPLIDIKFLERADGADKIIDSMKSKQQGQRVIETSTRTVARGVVINEGIQTKIVKSTYYWNHIPNSEYSLCVVVGDGDKQQRLGYLTPTDDVFLYHKRSLQKEANIKDCKNFVRKATTDRSTIQLNPSAFMDPSNLLYKRETETIVYSYKEYFTKKGASNKPGFKEPNVKNSVIASHFAEKYWKQNTELDTLVIWRYFGTMDGFIRVYPGVEVNLKGYDHELRPWWRRSISQKGRLVLTTPYVDLWGAGYVLSILKTIYKGKSGVHTTDDKVEAVLGLDVPLSYFHNVLIQSNTKCNQEGYICMLIDVSGFIVIHPDFISSHISNNDRHIETVHIVSKESGIANDLINHGIMTKRSCTDFNNKKIQYTYKVELTQQHINGLDRLNSIAAYELRPVEGTNVFVVIKEAKFVSQCCKQLPMHSPDTWKCLESSCECLCYKDMTINICTGYINLKDVTPTCMARTPDVIGISPSEDVSKLQACFDPKCSRHSSETECYKFACSWCVGDGNAIFDEKCCSAKEVCEFGIVPTKGDNVCKPNGVTSPPPGSEQTKQEDSFTLPVVGGVLGALVVILLIIIVVICRKYEKGLFARRHKPQDDYLTPVPYPDQTGIDNTGHQPHSIESLPRSQPPGQEVRYFTSTHTDSDNSIKSENFLDVMNDDLKT